MTRVTLENSYGSHKVPDIVTDALVIGTGPAGGALASFLVSHGKSTTVQSEFCISKIQTLTIMASINQVFVE